MSDYWGKCIEEAFEDAGITATKEQIDTVVGWVEGGHENYGLATGEEFIPNPLLAEIESLKASYSKETEARDNQEYKASKERGYQRQSQNNTIYELRETIGKLREDAL